VARDFKIRPTVNTQPIAIDPSWKGVIAGAWGDGDPGVVLHGMQRGPVAPTPTNIGITVARLAYVRLDTALVVNKIRFFGVGVTTNVFRVAIYRDSDSARLTAELPFTTAAQAWGSAGSALGVTLAANTLYFVACAVNAIGTTAGPAAMTGTATATSGQLGVLPTAWPGSLDIDAAPARLPPFALAQFAVTAGALPTTAPARVTMATWTGGMPAFFLDSSNA
jgi:hypothetical protein